MAYKVVFAPTAIARLEDIVRYIATDDPATASTFAMHLLDRDQTTSRLRKLLKPRTRNALRGCRSKSKWCCSRVAVRRAHAAERAAATDLVELALVSLARRSGREDF